MGIVLQYTLVYCSEKGMRKAVCVAIQTGCTGRGAGQALGAGGGGQGVGRSGLWACAGVGRAGIGRWHTARQQARGVTGACGLGVLLGQQAVHLVHSACF